jgi:hypothetical protein
VQILRTDGTHPSSEVPKCSIILTDSGLQEEEASTVECSVKYATPFQRMQRRETVVLLFHLACSCSGEVRGLCSGGAQLSLNWRTRCSGKCRYRGSTIIKP